MASMHSSELTNDYASAGFGGALPFGDRPALINVDVVVAYLQIGSPLYAARFETALNSCERVTKAARAAGMPIIFTNVVFSPDGRDGGLFFQKVRSLRSFCIGSPLGAFPATLTPEKNDLIVSKQYASAFFGTSLASTLTAMRINTVLITGFSTSGCVRATALDALQHGFAPFVVSDACGDRDEAPHQANLFDLQAKYAEVVDETKALKLIKETAQSAL